jgi:hypothetical protein
MGCELNWAIRNAGLVRLGFVVPYVVGRQTPPLKLLDRHPAPQFTLHKGR